MPTTLLFTITAHRQLRWTPGLPTVITIVCEPATVPIQPIPSPRALAALVTEAEHEVAYWLRESLRRTVPAGVNRAIARASEWTLTLHSRQAALAAASSLITAH